MEKCPTGGDDDPSLIPLLSTICRHFKLCRMQQLMLGSVHNGKVGTHHKASLKWNPQVKHIRHECLFI